MAHYKTKGFETPEGDTYDIIPPAPEPSIRGGITAEEKTSSDTTYTLEVKVDPTTSRAFVQDKLRETGQGVLYVDEEGYICITGDD